jgi:hypothetical protein
MLRGVMHSPAHVCSVLQCLFPDIEAAKIAAKVRTPTTHTLGRPQRDKTHSILAYRLQAIEGRYRTIPHFFMPLPECWCVCVILWWCV